MRLPRKIEQTVAGTALVFTTLGAAACSEPFETGEIGLPGVEQGVDRNPDDTNPTPEDDGSPRVKPLDNASTPTETSQTSSGPEASSFNDYRSDHDLDIIKSTWSATWSKIRGATEDGPQFHGFMDELINDALSRTESGDPVSESNSILLIGNDQNETVIALDGFSYYGWNFGEEGANITYSPVIDDPSNYDFLTVIYKDDSGGYKAISIGERGSTLPSDEKSFLLGAFVPKSSSDESYDIDTGFSSRVYGDFNEAFEASSRLAYERGLIPVHSPSELKSSIG